LANTVKNEQNETTSRPATVTSTATSHCIACNVSAVCCSVLQCVAVCCSVLQCVAECCSVLQCVAVCCSACTVCCSVVQCVAVYCSVLQCVYSVFGDYSRKTTQTLTMPRVCPPLSHTHTPFKPLNPALSLFLYLVVCIFMSLSHTHSMPLSL